MKMMRHKKTRREKKICFAASSGGHLEQLMMLEPLMEKYDSFIVTERTEYRSSTGSHRVYYVDQVNRKERAFPLKMLRLSIHSLGILIKERPDVVITTGVLAMIPISLQAKLFGMKLIYIESFAKITTPNQSGRLLYRFADQFYVQWESMLKVYPDAIYKGGIY